MVTLAQLKRERKAAFRAVLKEVNKVQKQLNSLHRNLTRRLTKHNVELLDVKDAEVIVKEINLLWHLANGLNGNAATDLQAFFY
jgi:hypothetical protein